MHCTKCNAKLDTQKGYVCCPHCGEPLEKDKPSNKDTAIGCIILLIIAFAIGSCFFGGSDKENEATSKETNVKPTSEQAPI